MPLKINTDTLKSALVKTAGLLLKSDKDADEALGELLLDVQRANIYGDGKLFVDLVPLGRLSRIKQEYAVVRQDPDFDLYEFVSSHFRSLDMGTSLNIPSTNYLSPLEYIDGVWDVLERRNRVARGSLLALPYKYVVPGGRFNEQFYWDSYFIMLGLASSNRWSSVEWMMKNFTHQIRKYGYIPTANRTYLTSRSQPPFFSHMVELLAGHKGRNKVLREYLPYLLAEYRFWMRGRSGLENAEYHSSRRVVRMPDHSLLNRYYDNKMTPRPESLREDTETAEASGRAERDRLYLHLRAGAESGWDFSSRWFLDAQDIRTIHAADILPVDLNCLLYHLEKTIASAYRVSANPIKAQQFKAKAERRSAAIQSYFWSTSEGFYKDYNFHKNTPTDIKSLAGVFPLYVGIATQDQADAVAGTIRDHFLHQGGLVATLTETGQQWDSPNGWAPLHWVVIQGLRKYGHDDLAEEISNRWTALNEKVYAETGRFIEKYNVRDSSGVGSGGEYAVQDGFGWTNGVYVALKQNLDI